MMKTFFLLGGVGGHGGEGAGGAQLISRVLETRVGARHSARIFSHYPLGMSLH